MWHEAGHVVAYLAHYRQFGDWERWVHQSLDSALALFALALMLSFLASSMYRGILDFAHEWFDWNGWSDRISSALVAFGLLVGAFGQALVLVAFVPTELPPTRGDRFVAVACISVLLILKVLSDGWENFKSIRRAFSQYGVWESWLRDSAGSGILTVSRVAHARDALALTVVLVSFELYLLIAFTAIDMLPAVVDLQAAESAPRRSLEVNAGIVGGALVGVATLRTIERLIRLSNAGPSVLRAAMCPVRMPSPQQFRISRWRSESHRRGFRLADEIERALPSLRGRLPRRDYEFVLKSYLKLGDLIRSDSISAERNTATMIRFDILCIAATSLVTSDSVTEAARRVMRLTSLLPDQEYVNRPKMIRALELVDNTLSRFPRVLRLLGIGLVAALLLFLGRSSEALDLLRSVLM